MSETEPVAVGLRITAALDYARSSNEMDMRAHYLWQVQQITSNVSLDDLTTPELVSLAALLIPPHSRVLSGRRRTEPTSPVGKVLRLV